MFARLLQIVKGCGGERNKPPRSAVVGAWGEARAAAFLTTAGYAVIGQNVRPDRHDEIDLVARRGDTLVFVEVKTRRNEDFGRPASAVDRGKRRALGRAALRYLHRVKAKPARIRFDVVEVVGAPDGAAPVVRHIEHAFSLGPGYRLPW